MQKHEKPNIFSFLNQWFKQGSLSYSQETCSLLETIIRYLFFAQLGHSDTHEMVCLWLFKLTSFQVGNYC